MVKLLIVNVFNIIKKIDYGVIKEVLKAYAVTDVTAIILRDTLHLVEYLFYLDFEKYFWA